MVKKNHQRVWLKRALTPLMLLSLVACSEIIDLRIMGSIGKGVTFELYEHNTNNLLNHVNVSYVCVYDKTGGDRRPIWKIKGSAIIPTIKYGKEISGLKQVVEPDSFAIGRLYEVAVGLKGSPPRRGGGHFCFDETGALVRLDSLEQVGVKCPGIKRENGAKSEKGL